MPKHRALAKINDDYKKSVEPPRANQNLIKPILGVPINVMYIVHVGHADFVKVQCVDI